MARSVTRLDIKMSIPALRYKTERIVITYGSDITQSTPQYYISPIYSWVVRTSDEHTVFCNIY